MTTALVLTAGSPQIGAGHIMRCLVFADKLAWAGWAVVFAINRGALAVAPALRHSGHRVIEYVRADELRTVFDSKAELIVTDSYAGDALYETALARDGGRLIVFDDLANRKHFCDILVDPTPGRAAVDYQRFIPSRAQALLGPRFAMVHRAYREKRAAACRRQVKGIAVRRILVSMGSTDPTDATSSVIESIKTLGSNVRVDVILGAGAPHRERIAGRLAANMRLCVEPDELDRIVAEADVAIGAPGSSSFERFVVGLPSILIPVANNQMHNARAMDKAGAAMVLPTPILNDAQAFGSVIAGFIADKSGRIALSRAASQLTDGRGAERLLVALSNIDLAAHPSQPTLRLAEAEDEEWLLALQRRPKTRRYARNPNVPSQEKHRTWLGATLENPSRLLMVVEKNGIPVAMVRLDKLAEHPLTFEISIAVEERCWGQGIGKAALVGVRRIVPAADIVATVMPENQRSIELFLFAGYRRESESLFRSQP
jgi:UDP-2,4-diacetamido-2,4,6-trideoxy-beta-L-altropyranose hydrolase